MSQASPGDSVWRAPAAFAALVVGSTFAVDVGVRHPDETPKQWLVVAVVCVLLVLWSARGLRRRHAVHVSILEALMAGVLLLAVVGRPELLRGTPILPVGVALLGITFLCRQWGADGVGGTSGGRLGTTADLVHVVWINGVAQAMLGFRQAWDAGTFRFAGDLAKTPMTGTLGAPNAFGAVVALGAAAAVSAARSARSSTSRNLLLGAAGVCAGAVLANGSRGAMLGLLVGVGGAVLLPWAVRRARARGWSAARWAGVLAGTAVTAGGLGVALALLNPASSGGRLLAWRISVPMVLQHPLRGVGAGGYGAVFAHYQAAYFSHPDHLRWAYKATWLRSPQSQVLLPFVETGIPGGILALLLWGGALVWLVRATARASSERADTDVALLMLLAVILVHGTVDSILLVLPVAVVAHAVAGLVPAPAVSWRPGRGGWVGLFAATLGLAALGAGRIARDYPAQGAWLQGALRGGAQGIPYLERAAAALPLEGRLQQELGQALLAADSAHRAIGSLDRAVALGAPPEAGLELAEAYLADGRPDAAQGAANAYLAAYPDRLRPRLILAKADLALGASAEARRQLTRCIRKETHIRSEAVDRIAREAEALWRSHFSDAPPAAAAPKEPTGEKR